MSTVADEKLLIGTGSSLKLTSIDLKNQGQYSCLADNGLKTLDKSFKVDIQ